MHHPLLFETQSTMQWWIQGGASGSERGASWCEDASLLLVIMPPSGVVTMHHRDSPPDGVVKTRRQHRCHGNASAPTLLPWQRVDVDVPAAQHDADVADGRRHLAEGV